MTASETTGATPPRARSRARRLVGVGLAAAVGGFLAIQFVPYGWSHPNPPIVEDASWPDDESAAIGAMPPDRYTLIHRGARLTDDEADRLVAALQAMEAGGGDDNGSGRGGGDD